MGKYKITVLLPVCNQKQKFLKESINSLINQDYKYWICFIIFEGRKLNNLSYIKNIISRDKRFKLINPPQKIGLAGSLNLGLNKTKTEYVARFDSDDIMHKNRLSEQLNFLERNKSISVVGSNLKIINDKGKKIGIRLYPKSGKALILYFIIRCGLAHPSTLFRLKDILSIGMYRQNLLGAEDLDLWLRMIKNGFKFHNIQKPLLFYRKNEFRSLNHWENVYKVRSDNSGIFTFLVEKIVLICFKVMILMKKFFKK